MYQDTRAAIIAVIDAQADTIQEACRTLRSKLDAFPVALVRPSEAEADYSETAARANKETYVFDVRVLYPFVEGQETADLAIEKSLDELITIFRDRNVLGAAADWCSPAPSVWGFVETASGTMRCGEIKIRAVKHVRG